MLVLVIVFLTVPILIYQQFLAADREKRELLLRDAQLQGELIARSLARVLFAPSTTVTNRIPDTLADATRQYPAACVWPVFSPSTFGSLNSKPLRFFCVMPL